ncbi:helix-turn-helix domain-containing protein [Mycobacteroides abscessus]|uniref:ImmA/IrrE family metallo-endopeptidase n=1 Tax=Mycobacteroides abscessus TaxID=36809 RepID=A0ABD7HIS5_9MYCO|nr:XRE family transcriptional regulator [Mycobacteroides abscessus]AWG65092.1 ImmA/IrrE family metallo-endopeptidase [Mycobacteroides abscessus]PVA77462.1 ImmA/IrrE family metallo-endopeptidase [Mycobacteroides abscessus]PVB23664.1 ImmA/IrrE family metallo-endopeptidase [Mycobacteroides abscessus]RIR48331.1 ImmA/IrrE family metallo-endopeptidase [Mycobacteroides abscessus]RIR63392.1 ImmA/IrrE family metallo-endopeptidase [Mycobacteroides abscessus]
MLAASPAERLRVLRALLGVTQEELASLSGVKQSWISQVETAAREPTADGLAAIASATDTPLGFFDVRPATVPLDSLRFRKTSAASKVVTRRVHAFYAESFRVSESLVGEGGYPMPPLPLATDEALSAQDIELWAERAREFLRVAPDSPIPHLTRSLERAGVPVAPMMLAKNLEDGEPASATGHFGISYWGGVGAPALIGLFPGSQGDRSRFTLAHELGHIVLHTYRPQAADAENEAHRFAGALLVPRHRAEETISESTTLSGFARLKATWGVSIQALIVRAADLGLIGDTRKRSLFVQLSSKGWRKNEPVAVGHESPLLLWTLLSRKYGDRPYRAASEDLAIHPTVLRSIAPSPNLTTRSVSEPEVGSVRFLKRN